MDHFLVTFWIPFGNHFGTHFRTRASKTKKATFSKKWFSRRTVCIFSLLRPPKELLNPKKRDPKLTQKLTKFGPILGFKMGLKSIPQNYSKKNQKIEPKQTCYYMAFHLKLNFQCLKRPLLAPYLEPHLGIRFAQEATRWAQESHQELQRPKNSLFITLKKPMVFTRFWVQRLPKRASRGPRRLPRGNQRAPKPKEKLKINERQNRIAGRKCLSPAISIYQTFETHFGTL